jgi:hypothetical protein
MLAFAEGMYANLHPDVGFTCSLSDLVSQAKPFGVDPAIANGVFSGYKFALSGCQGTPAGSFQLTAEPAAVAPGVKAFCTDATHNIRFSEDGRAATCLVSGKSAVHFTAQAE